MIKAARIAAPAAMSRTMPSQAIPADPSHFRLWREVQDMRVRTSLGGIFYLIAWLLCWVFSSAPEQLLLPGSLFSLVFAILLVLRLRHRLPTEHDLDSLLRWRWQHWALLLLNSMFWGLATGCTLLLTPLHDSQLIAALSTIAFSTAAIFNFPMQRLPAACAVVLIYLPSVVIMLPRAAEQIGVLITLGFFLLYLLLALRRNHREYHAGVDLQHQLLEQREQLDLLSRTDSLTQLGNRLQFNNLFEQQVALAKRQGSPLALLLLDIDHFKQINDQHGHMVGDHCLRQFADAMRQVFRRQSDSLLRLGGEEFGVLMPGTDLEQARQLGEQFRLLLAEQGLSVQGQPLRLTTSLGLGVFDSDCDATADTFFSRVDEALYQAKYQGRNQLKIA